MRDFFKNFKYMLMLFITIGAALVDQITKIMVNSRIELGDSITIIDNFLNITYVRNKGIVFGMFYNWLNIFTIVTILGIAISLEIVHYIYKNRATIGYLQSIALSLILGGAIGNTIDRVFRGFVIDFIDFRGIWSFIFNGADTFINIGIGLLILHSLVYKNSSSNLCKKD